MAIEDLKWADTDINFPSTGQPNKSGTIPSDLQIEGFEPFQGYDAEIFNEWMNRAYRSVEDLQTQINALNAQVATGIEPAFPVGSLYINKTDGTDPATLLGFGTWTAVEGVAVAGAGTYTDSRGEQRTFSAGTVEGTYRHVVTTNEMPSHTHSGTVGGAYGGYHPGSSGIEEGRGAPDWKAVSISSTGGGQPHNNIQPTLFAYVWERTA